MQHERHLHETFQLLVRLTRELIQNFGEALHLQVYVLKSFAKNQVQVGAIFRYFYLALAFVIFIIRPEF